MGESWDRASEGESLCLGGRFRGIREGVIKPLDRSMGQYGAVRGIAVQGSPRQRCLQEHLRALLAPLGALISLVNLRAPHHSYHPQLTHIIHTC